MTLFGSAGVHRHGYMVVACAVSNENIRKQFSFCPFLSQTRRVTRGGGPNSAVKVGVYPIKAMVWGVAINFTTRSD